MACPVGDFDEVIAVSQDAAEGTEQDIDEVMFAVACQASGIRDGLELLEQGTGHRGHGEAVQKEKRYRKPIFLTPGLYSL
jgi:hypothetical protein